MTHRFECSTCILRQFEPEDAPSFARHANDREIWRNLRDLFPHPYSLADAEEYIARVLARDRQTSFAIEVDGEVCGSIGLVLGSDVERCSAELGYWIGRTFWGRGVVTDAARAVTNYGLTTLGLTRVFAIPYARNTASMRVLEKAGFRREGVMRRAIIKEDEVLDAYLYAATEPLMRPPGDVAGTGAVDARGSRFEIREWAHGAMSGPPLHVHHSDDEAWHVLDGTLHFRFANSTSKADAGETVFVPAGVAHTYGSPADVRYLIISTPRVFELIAALHAEGLDDDAVADVYRQHDSEIVE